MIKYIKIDIINKGSSTASQSLKKKAKFSPYYSLPQPNIMDAIHYKNFKLPL